MLRTVTLYRAALDLSRFLFSLSENCAELYSVHIWSCQGVTDTAIYELITKCRNLRRLVLHNCTELTAQTVHNIVNEGEHIERVTITGKSPHPEFVRNIQMP